MSADATIDVAPKTRAVPAWLRGDAPCLLLLAAFTFAHRAVWFGDPVADFDEQLYSFIGWRMQFGEVPFVDWWDRKPFGLFAIFGLIHALLGPSALAYQLAAAGFTFVSGWLTFLLARRCVDRTTATFAAAIAVMLVAAYANYSANSEVFFAPLVLGMAVLLVDAEHPQFTRRAMLAMLLGGLALQVKYTVLPQCAFFGAWALWVEHRRGRAIGSLASLAAAFALLGLMPTLGVALFYAAIGQFEAFWFANFASFFERAAGPQGRWASNFYVGVSPLVVLSAGGIYAAFRMKRPEPFAAWAFFAAWALSALASVLLPSTVYLYYYAALAAPVALVALPLLDRTGPLRIAPAILLSAALLFLLSLPARYEQSLDQREAAHQLAATIAPHVDGKDNCLWVWDGPTVLYRLSGSCVPTRYVYPDHLNNALETNALEVDQLAEVRRVLATRPGAIVTADRGMTIRNPEAMALVEASLRRNYEPRLTVTMHERQVTAWVRSSSSARASATTGTAPRR
ncbi:glycosyltransferase family 39 protein [Aurantiacibacter odishensis]|uniref:glycosyltransferase family 39 protein n=1 Tax=Aurantiacibacter odishensis TaxID=1155476 RepID=UPI000E71EBC5|nr:glycosyltransferase family 39 protein [Aurantiacibacter odishensis]